MQLAWFRAVGRWATLLLSSVLAKFQAWVRAFMVWMVSAGPIPTHIAFIMDGNRRFADRLHVDRRIGHSHGYDALLGTLKDCFDLQVKTVTLFAFSIDNFHRPPDEVSALMELMQTKLETLIEKQGLASQYGIQVRVLGDLHLLPKGARMAAEKAMAVTSQNSSLVLNLCISYTSTHEIVESIRQTRNNFLAACGGSCEQFSHPSCSCSKAACQDEVANVFENGFHIMQGGNDVVTNGEYNHGCNGGNGDRIFETINSEHVNGNGCSKTSDSELKLIAESKMSGKDIPLPANEGLRKRHQKKAGFQDSACYALCSSDVYSHTGTYVDEVGSNVKRVWSDSIRNGCKPREDVVCELNHGNFHQDQEVVDSCTSDLSTSHQSSSDSHPSRKHWCYLRQNCSKHSCEIEAEVESLSTYNFDQACYLCNRIFEVAKDCVSEEEIGKNLYTHACPPPDLLIRTSGETRLSNFLLWQTSFSHLAFCKVLWPEFSFRHLFFIILEYQRAFPSLLRKRQYYNSESWRHS